MRIHYRITGSTICRLPLPCTTRTLLNLPFVVEKIFKIIIVPLCRFCRPCALNSTCDSSRAIATLKRVLPPEPLLLNRSALWLDSNVLTRICRTVTLSERMTTGNERHRLFIIHCHTSECFTNIFSCSHGVRLSVGPFRVYVDKSHLNSREWVIKLSLTRVSLVAKPLSLWTPVRIPFWLPHICSSAGKTQRLKSHRLQRTVASKDHEICP